MSEAALRLSNIERHYSDGATEITVLRGVDVTLAAGEVVALLGPSGSGKSTLLHIAGLLEHPSMGEIYLGGTRASTHEQERTALRRDTVGFVFQFHNLLPEFTALENVMMAARIAGVARDAAESRARELLDGLGLESRLVHLPSELSGGEQQRVAIARALMNRPQIILADEPTGSLDAHTGAQVFALLIEQARLHSAAVLIATHNQDLARITDRTLTLRGARIS